MGSEVFDGVAELREHEILTTIYPTTTSVLIGNHVHLLHKFKLINNDKKSTVATEH